MMTVSMTLPETCLECGELVDLKTAMGAGEGMTVLVQTDDLQLTRVEVPAGRVLPPQRMIGDVTMQCLAGRVKLQLCDGSRELSAGQLVYLAARESFAVTGIEDAVLLETMVLPTEDFSRPYDDVQEASEESFPASDPPAH